ncbi:gamma-glutamyltransferase [Paracoccus sanguinis]|uniref:Glutathione hydrolase proenzyme n=1 Tax=Paracoccus sanguinis TaxID=1545044 RepID=A0A099G779_9RHOB|nr:gamma-glutamyltransferase [Paracoccus sanguinis]KGJ18466.1 gamma-glutamyltransferase [Paracoccus sanguinis]
MRCTIVVAAVLSATGAVAQQATDAIAPEAASVAGSGLSPAFAGLSTPALAALADKEARRPVKGQEWMVAAAHPAAVEAGAKILDAGGTAADAMVAVQTVLGLVEPQSSGIGGGAFLVWYDAASGQLTTLDAREKAPAAATPTLFLDDAGEPLSFMDAVVGGRSVGVPGTPALLEEAHRRWGRANWGTLFEPAIALAENGFAVSPRLAGLVAGSAEQLARDPDTAAYFLPGGTPVAEGTVIRNPRYAGTLRGLAMDGADYFYHGPNASALVDKVRGAEWNPGVMTLDDLAAYRVVERPPVCVTYRAHDVCGMGPPSSGALTLGQILGMLSGHDLAALGPVNPESWRLIGDASRLAFADRERYMADSDFVPVPTSGLVDPDYLADRARLLDSEKALPEVEAGTPTFQHAMLWGRDNSIEIPSTSHISIVDRYGNALAMTTTIEGGFGSHLMANGYLLNNELTDFSFRTHDKGWPVANRVEPNKRPRSSMAPTIVLKDGKPVMVTGSPGGSRIIGYVAKAVIAQLDWGMDPQQAAAVPNLVNRFGKFDVEQGTTAEGLIGPLTGLGFEVAPAELTSGLHTIVIGPGGLLGGADPRREGIALGK